MLNGYFPIRFISRIKLKRNIVIDHQHRLIHDFYLFSVYQQHVSRLRDQQHVSRLRDQNQREISSLPNEQ